MTPCRNSRPLRRACSFGVVWITLWGGGTAVAQPAEAEAAAVDRGPAYYYYFSDGVGAHAFYNPQNFIVQGGLGALYDERVDTFEWGAGFATVNRSLASPVQSIDDYGWERFFYREFVPHIGPGQNYVPNWVWHFTGGGMRRKLMEEFYTEHGFEYPGVWSWLTMYSAHYLNEAVQAARFNDRRRSTIDAVADMYFFDWAGGLLFHLDPVNRFMSRTLHMREWSYQAQFDPVTRRLLNNGQLYWLRVELLSPVSFSFLTGEQITSLNLTFELGAGRQLSAGLGPKSKAFIARDNGDTDPSSIVFSVGVFYSIDDNPLLTLTYEPKDASSQFDVDGKYLLNLYPGPLRVFDYPVGVSVAFQEQTVFAGVAFGHMPAGLAASTP